MTVNVGVLISGSGTNLQALLDASNEPGYPARVSVVIASRPGVFGLERAERSGVPAVVVPFKQFPERVAFEERLIEVLAEYGVEWIACAGFMKLFTPRFLEAFPNRILNIHPALMPAFPGMHAQRQALEAGVRIAGASVHFVDAGTDTGPVILQGAVPVLADDDEESLSARILGVEHRIYKQALRWAAEGRLHVEGKICRVDLKSGDRTWIFSEAEGVR
jgi:phosphoribosylglycinamide formyltransferase-1